MGKVKELNNLKTINGIRYDYQTLYFAMLVNEFSESNKYEVYKTKKDVEGDDCLGGGWFSVSIVLPVGVLKHYFCDFYWDLFHCKEVDKEYEIYIDTRDDLKEKIITFVKGEQTNGRNEEN